MSWAHGCVYDQGWTVVRLQGWNRYDYMDIGGRAMQELLPRVESGTETESNAGRLHGC